ncbi:DUF4163 domain-containing protein [Sphingomonas sp. ASV193]|uniref:DUF4163 domain-containing protein n=1 Tax=Sphingomonas sp. ASV193 TaxID=3144405 RepID=UPI0032E8967E
MRLILLCLAALAGGCHSKATHDRLANGEELTLNDSGAVVDAAPRPATPAAKAGSLESNDALLTSSLKWSAEVAAVPLLLASIKADFARQQADLRKSATKDRKSAKSDGRDFHPYEQSRDYRTAGRSSALLSLAEDWYEYTGGAHPNHGTSGLLWDRAAKRQVKPIALFARPANRDARLRAPYCAALEAERKKRRGNEPDTFFSDCPKLDDLALVPTDKSGGGRFDTILLHADPYVAGPYAEGDYDIELPVTAALIAALKPEWRASFAAGR